LTPNDHYSGRTAPLTSMHFILYIYSTNICTEYFKHGVYSPVFPLQNAVCFIILTYFVPVLFTFYIQGVLKLKKNNSGAKRLIHREHSVLSFEKSMRKCYIRQYWLFTARILSHTQISCVGVIQSCHSLSTAVRVQRLGITDKASQGQASENS